MALDRRDTSTYIDLSLHLFAQRVVCVRDWNMKGVRGEGRSVVVFGGDFPIKRNRNPQTSPAGASQTFWSQNLIKLFYNKMQNINILQREKKKAKKAKGKGREPSRTFVSSPRRKSLTAI